MSGADSGGAARGRISAEFRNCLYSYVMISHYFAYGSNMNPRRMLARGIAFNDSIAGSLKGFELCFDKRAPGKPRVAHANIRYARHAEVEGVLYSLADPVDIANLDRYEGTPVRYSREVYAVNTLRGIVHAWVYVGNRAMLAEGLFPERSYLQHLLAASVLYSSDYRRRLEMQSCVEDGGLSATADAGVEVAVGPVEDAGVYD